MNELVPERGKIAVVFESEPNVVHQMTEAELGSWCARIAEGEVIRPDSFRAKSCTTLIQRRTGLGMVTDVGQLPTIEAHERFETVITTLDDARVYLSSLLGHIFVETNLDDRCPEKLAQLQDLSQRLSIITGQIDETGQTICQTPTDKVA